MTCIDFTKIKRDQILENGTILKYVEDCCSNTRYLIRNFEIQNFEYFNFQFSSHLFTNERKNYKYNLPGLNIPFASLTVIPLQCRLMAHFSNILQSGFWILVQG